MTYTLQNQHITLQVDAPSEQYQLSRFDWTGKIVKVIFQGQDITGQELAGAHEVDAGIGLYNEFGITRPIGYHEVCEGEWFHKIGVGLLQKEGEVYNFRHPYTIRPAQFEVQASPEKLVIACKSEEYRGYAYHLTKVIRVEKKGFVIEYDLKNQGEKTLRTDEYVHNFMAIHDYPINADYSLHFPFLIRPDRFEETVNPEGLINILEKEIRLKGQPGEPFFFSNLSGDEEVLAQWELRHPPSGLTISETGNFKTKGINVWGAGHVISPELFFEIDLPPGESVKWSRTYRIVRL